MWSSLSVLFQFPTALLFSAVRFVIIDCVTHFGASLLLTRHHPNRIKCLKKISSSYRCRFVKHEGLWYLWGAVYNSPGRVYSLDYLALNLLSKTAKSKFSFYHLWSFITQSSVSLCLCFVLFLTNITQITRDSFRLHLMLLLYLPRRAQVWWIRWAEYKTLKTTLMFLMISSQCWSICRRFRVFGKFTWWKTLQAALTELPCSPTAKLQVHGGFYDSQ